MTRRFIHAEGVAAMLSLYPGGRDTRQRFGQVDVHVDIGDAQAPDQWNVEVGRVTTNDTGTGLGYFVRSASVTMASSDQAHGFKAADYVVKVVLDNCSPFGPWRRHDLSATIKAVSRPDEGPSAWISAISGDKQFTLYRTPKG